MSNLHTVTDADDDIRLDRWFKRHFPAFPHGMLEKSLRKGEIRVDGKKAEANLRIKEGQVIDIRCQIAGVGTQQKLPPKPVSPEDEKMMQRAVLYKDENIIVINKPFGIAVQGGSKITRSIDGMLDALKFGGERPKLVHRLDRDTTGALVLARTTKAAQKLMKIFATRQVEKTYWALINGVPLEFSGTINLPLSKKENPKAQSAGRRAGPDGRDYEIMMVDHKNGQSAVSEYRILEHLARKFALVELMPLTGRTHQLRVHMQAIGCPIVGDPKYGGSMIYDEVTDASTLGIEDKLHLHARRILIPAGTLGSKAVDVRAPLPQHMSASFDALGIHPPKK